MKIGKIISVGVQADLFSTRRALDYESTNELTCEIGFMVKPADGLSVGLHTFNPVPDRIRKLDMPTVITFGAAYLFSDTFLTTVDIESSNTGHTNLRIGMELKAYENFFFRGGLMTNPSGISFGFGYSGNVLQGNIGFITHENLGLTPSLSIVIFIR
jgi:hypothetical protein